MDIVAASYLNIGPFVEQPITLVFERGKYLIKAPIGTGKSFLFFDGPLFGLYKSASRPMLNRHAENGYVQLVFEEAESLWLIERQIKMTKSGGDSVQSRFFALEGVDKEEVMRLAAGTTQGLIQWGESDVKSLLASYVQELSFSNQRELEKSLADLLPPKEVLTSVYFLMQEKENVFEMTPAERITVFKHLFGLVGIDHAKEKLRDARKEVQVRMQLLGDTSHETKELQKALATLSEVQHALSPYQKQFPHFAPQLHNFFANALFVDLEIIRENVQIDQFSIDVESALLEEVLASIKQYQQQGAELTGKLTQVKQQHQQVQQEQKNVVQEIARIQGAYDKLSRSMQAVDEQKIKALSVERKDIYEQQQHYEAKYNREDSCYSQLGVHGLAEAVSAIDRLIHEGKYIQEQIASNDLQIKHNQEQQQVRVQRTHELQSQIALLDKSYAEQNTFRCDKIQGDCPYVQVIKGASLKTLEQQKEHLQKQVGNLEKSAPTLDVQKDLFAKKSLLEQQREEKRSMLAHMPWKSLKQDHAARLALTQKLKSLDQDMYRLEQQRQQLDTRKAEQMELAAQQKSQHQQQLLLQKKLEEIQLTAQHKQQELGSLQLQDLQSLQQLVETCMKYIDQITQLVHGHKQKHLQHKILMEKEKKLKELSAVFSKELLLVVLDDFLPTLEQVMNSFLAKIVDYEVRLSVPVETEEKMELQIFVHDAKGKRKVRSLSGGQKAVLKLVWVLAIATMMKGEFLFLDETIISMDGETVAKAAYVLEDFVQQEQHKFYLVTHSQQIQDMDIWDSVLTIVSPNDDQEE